MFGLAVTGWLVGSSDDEIDGLGRGGCSARRAATPVDDLGFVDLETVVVIGGETRRVPHRAVDVEHDTTAATNQVVMVVVGTVLVARNGTGGLDPSQQTFVDEHRQRVVDRLARDGADACPDAMDDVVGRGVRSIGYDPHDRQTLGRDLHAVLSEKLFHIGHVKQTTHNSGSCPLFFASRAWAAPTWGSATHMAATSDHTPVSPLLVRVGAVSWRLLAAGAVVWGVASLTSTLTTIVAPIAVALLLAGIIEPVVRRVERPGWPSWVAPLGAVLLVLVVLAGLIAGIGVRLAEEWPDLRDEFSASLDDLEDRFSIELPSLPGTDDSSTAVSTDGSTNGSTNGEVTSSDARRVLTVGSEILFGIFLSLALAFLFLKDGDRMWRWLLDKVPSDRRDGVDDAGRAAWSTTGAYVRGLTIVAVFDAVGVAVGLLVLGVPLVITLATLQFLASYIPTIGAFAAGGVAVVVALGSEGVVVAVIVLAIVVVVQQLGNNVIEPWVMDRNVDLHPAVVLIAVGTGAILWGIAGALLFVPLAAALSAAGSVWWERRSPAAADG